MATGTIEQVESLLATLRLDEGFHPPEPHSENDSGLSPSLVEDLVLKYLSGKGAVSGREIADHICLPMAVLENRYAAMRSRQEISPVRSGMLGDHVYQLTDQGRNNAQPHCMNAPMRSCAGTVGRLCELGAGTEHPQRETTTQTIGSRFLGHFGFAGFAQPFRAGDQCWSRHVHLWPSW